VEASPLDRAAVGADPERVVAECCAAGAPAVVTFREGDSGLRALFSSFRNGRVGLEMTDEPSGVLREGAVCHVAFRHRGRPVVFTAPVRSSERGGGRLLVLLGVPARISSEGVRSAFRVPVGEPPLAVELVGDDAVTWSAELVNASLTGMFLRFPGDGPTLMPDQVVEIAVRIETERIRLAGVVRRVEDGGVGVFFPDAVAEPENPMRRVVAVLEHRWHEEIS